MRRTTLTHSIPHARIVIISPAGCCDSLIPATVAAVIVWFLSCLPAMAASVMIFRRVAALRLWLRGWREDLGLMWVALCMTARLEFA